jgi:predicted RNA-binding Zn-ribbon protein involved in translation (DUF1610 family)
MDTQQPATLAESRKAPIVVGSGDLLGIVKSKKTLPPYHIPTYKKILPHVHNRGNFEWKCPKCGAVVIRHHKRKPKGCPKCMDRRNMIRVGWNGGKMPNDRS